MSVHGDAGEDTRGGGREKEVTSRGREREREGGGRRRQRVAQRMAIGVGGMDRGGLVAKGRREYRDTPSARNRYGDGQGDRGIETTALCCLSVVFFFARRAWPPSRDDEFIRNVFWKRERLTVFQRFQQSMVKES